MSYTTFQSRTGRNNEESVEDDEDCVKISWSNYTVYCRNGLKKENV